MNIQKGAPLVEDKVCEDNLIPLEPLEEYNPTNEEKFDKLQIGCRHKEADQERWKILEEKAPWEVQVKLTNRLI